MRRVSFVVSALYPRPYFETYLHVSAHHSFCHHLPPPFFSSLTPCKLSLQHCLTFCIHLSIPVWIPFHLILTSQTLTLRYPSPPPPLIHPILPLLAWLIAETGPILRRGACKLSLTTATMSPPPIPSPSARIDYPTLQGDNQWAWPDFETWWVRACV